MNEVEKKKYNTRVSKIITFKNKKLHGERGYIKKDRTIEENKKVPLKLEGKTLLVNSKTFALIVQMWKL